MGGRVDIPLQLSSLDLSNKFPDATLSNQLKYSSCICRNSYTRTTALGYCRHNLEVTNIFLASISTLLYRRQDGQDGAALQYFLPYAETC